MSEQRIHTDITANAGGFTAAMSEAEAATQRLQQAAGGAGAGGLNELSEQLGGASDAASDTADALRAQAGAVIASGGSWRSLAALAGGAMQMLGGFTAVVTTVGVALYNASQESAELANALVLTGAQAGVTTDQLVSMSQAVAESAGATRTASTAALAEVVRSGGVAAEQMGMVADVALRLEDVGGQAIKQTVREFAELGKEPVAASLELSEKLGYLTAETYSQIKALEDQGKTSEAAALAQRAYGEALDEVAAGTEENLGVLERTWGTLTSAAALAWDAMLNIGRADTLAERLAEAKRQVTEGASWFERAAGFLSGETVDPSMSVKVIEAQIEAEEKAAKAKAAKIAQEAAHIKWLQDGERYLGKAAQMERDVAKARTEGLAAKRTEAEIEERIGQIRAKYASKAGAGSGGPSAAALAREAAAAEREQVKALREREKAEAAAIAMAERGLEALQSQVERQREANAEIGLTGLALVELRAARLEDAAATNEQAAMAAELMGLSKAEVQAYRDKAAALRELAGLQREGAQANAALADERERVQAAERAATQAEEAWRQSAQQIEASITDALMRGFESGKSIAETFRDTLTNMFKTLILRPVIQALVQPLAGGIASMVSGGSMAGGGGGDVLGTVGNVYSMASNVGSLFGLTGAGAAAGTVGMANMAGMVGGDALGTLIAGNSMGWGTSAAGLAGGGAMGAIGAALPWIGGGLAIASLLGAFDKKPSNKAAGGDVDLASGSMSGLWNMTGKKQASQQTMDGRTAFLQAIGAFGSAAGATGSVGIDIGERDGVQASFGGGALEKFGHDANTALMGILDRVVESATIDPKLVAQWQVLKVSLDGTSKSAADMVDVMTLLANDVGMVDIERANLIRQENESLGESYGRLAQMMGLNQTASEQWRLAQHGLQDEFAAMGVEVPRSTEAFADLLAGIDITTEAGQALFRELSNVGPAFLQVASMIEEAMQAIREGTQASVRSIEMAVLDDPGRYDYLQAELTAGELSLREAIDPAEVVRQAEENRATIMEAWQLVPADLRASLADEFIGLLNENEALANERLSVVDQNYNPEAPDASDDEHTGMAQAVASALEAVAAKMGLAGDNQLSAAETLARATESIPDRIVVSVGGGSGYTTGESQFA